MIDAALLADAVLANFGQSVTVTVGEVEHVLDGAWRGPYSELSIGGAPVEQPDPMVAVRSGDYEDTGARSTDKVMVGSQVYTLISARPRDNGLTELTLRPYP